MEGMNGVLSSKAKPFSLRYQTRVQIQKQMTVTSSTRSTEPWGNLRAGPEPELRSHHDVPMMSIQLGQNIQMLGGYVGCVPNDLKVVRLSDSIP